MSKLFVRKDVGLKLVLRGARGDAHDFEVVGPGPARATLANEAVEGISTLGMISPISPVTLPDEAKEGAGSALAALRTYEPPPKGHRASSVPFLAASFSAAARFSLVRFRGSPRRRGDLRVRLSS